MNLDMKEEMENIREESLLKSEHLTKLEKRNDQLQQEVSIQSTLYLSSLSFTKLKMLSWSSVWTNLRSSWTKASCSAKPVASSDSRQKSNWKTRWSTSWTQATNRPRACWRARTTQTKRQSLSSRLRSATSRQSAWDTSRSRPTWSITCVQPSIT